MPVIRPRTVALALTVLAAGVAIALLASRREQPTPDAGLVVPNDRSAAPPPMLESAPRHDAALRGLRAEPHENSPVAAGAKAADAVAAPPDRAGTIRGTVVDPTGKPVAGARVYVMPEFSSVLRRNPRASWTTRDGDVA